MEGKIMNEPINSLYTPQEHATFGSTVSEYVLRPYMPIAVQRGMSITECDKKRQEVGNYLALGYYWNKPYLECKIRLERLDIDGNTIKDPTLIILDVYCGEVINMNENFPFCRELNPRIELNDKC